MGQLVAGAAGAAIGFFVGGPTGAQLGWALGSALYASQQTIKGPSLGDAKVQTSQDGLPIAIIYGTSDCYGNVIDALPVDYRYVDVDSGGKGAPQQQEQRAYQTFAIMFCEGEATSVRRIWENEKLVYDVSEGSNILDESAEYAEGFEFYPGSETQLPDPDLEAYHGVGLTPAYRGICYIVWRQKDITPYGVAIPQIRVEIIKAPQEVTPGRYGAVGERLSAPTRAWSATNDLEDWDNSFSEYDGNANEMSGLISSGGDTLIGWQRNSSARHVWRTTDFGANWTYLGQVQPAGSNIDRNYGATKNQIWCIPGGSNYATSNAGVITSSDDGLTWDRFDSAFSCVNVALAGTTFIAFPGVDRASCRKSTDGETWIAGGDMPGLFADQHISQAAKGTSGGVCVSVGRRLASSTGRIARTADSGTSWTDITSPFITTASSSIVAVATDGLGNWVIGNEVGKIAYSVTNGQAFTECVQTYPGEIFDIVSDGDTFILCGDSDEIWYSNNKGVTWGVAANNPLTSYTAALAARNQQASPNPDRVSIASIVADQCERKGITSSLRDVSLITDTTRGFKVAGNYNAADVIRTLGQAYFFDSPEYDGKIRFLPRGRPVVLSIPHDDFVSEPEVEEYAQGEHAIEYPRVLRLVYAPEETQYQATTQTSERYSPSLQVKGEVVLEAPLNLDADEAAQIADKAHKVAWTDARGEVRFSVGDNHAELVPSDCIGVEVNGKLERLRITHIEDVDGERRIRARFDRQSAYDSAVTGIPPLPATTPPSTIVGETDFQWCNLPPMRPFDLEKQVYFGVQGLTTAWSGANIQRSNDGGSTWETVLENASFPTLIGTANALSEASRYIRDDVNTLTITIPGSTNNGTIETFLSNATARQLQDGANVISLQTSTGENPELIQFTTATEIADNTWELTGLYRGLRNTTPRDHDAGERAVFLNPSYAVNDLTANPYTSFLYRAVSLNNSTAGATQISVTWNPPRIWRVWAPELPPPWRGGAMATAARDAIIDAGDLSNTYFPPCRTSTDRLYVCAIVRGPNIYGNSWQLSGSSRTARITYIDGSDTHVREVDIITERPEPGTAPYAPLYVVRDTLSSAELTAIFGSVPSSLNVRIRVAHDLTGYDNDELEFTA